MRQSDLKILIKEIVTCADNILSERKEKWVQRAINPKNKGACTPMTKKTCTPHRKALAKRFKSGEFKEIVKEVVKECLDEMWGGWEEKNKKGVDEASYKVRTGPALRTQTTSQPQVTQRQDPNIVDEDNQQSE